MEEGGVSLVQNGTRSHGNQTVGSKSFQRSFWAFSKARFLDAKKKSTYKKKKNKFKRHVGVKCKMMTSGDPTSVMIPPPGKGQASARCCLL